MLILATAVSQGDPASVNAKASARQAAARRRGHKFSLQPVGDFAEARACLDVRAYVAENSDLHHFHEQGVSTRCKIGIGWARSLVVIGAIASHQATAALLPIRPPHMYNGYYPVSMVRQCCELQLYACHRAAQGAARALATHAFSIALRNSLSAASDQARC